MSNLLKRLVIFIVVCAITHSIQAQKISSAVLSYDQLMGIDKAKKEKPSSKSEHATLRLDMITESQKDDIIAIGDIPLHEICSIIINCPQNSNGPILLEGDRIRLFSDSRISEIQILKVSDGKEMIISRMTVNDKTSYLTVPQDIARNDDSYLIRIL